MNVPEGYIGLCAYCILNLNAANTPRVGQKNRGLAKDMEGEIIALSGGRGFKWEPGAFIPAGGNYLSDLVLTLGDGIDIEDYRGSLHPYAVTMNGGTLVCEEHNGETFHQNQVRNPYGTGRR